MKFEPKGGSQLIAKSFWQKIFFSALKLYQMGMYSLITRTNSSGKRANWSIMNRNVELAKHQNSVPTWQNTWPRKQVSQLKSHVGKPFTTREGEKQMRDVKECVTNPLCLVKLELRNIGLVTKYRPTQHKLMWFVWLKDDLCDHFKRDMMTTWGKIDSSEKPKHNKCMFS